MTFRKNLNIYFKQFIECHDGIANRLLHILGFALMILGIIEKSFMLVIAGALIQESGHFYQYIMTKKIKYNPLFCLKPQLIFFYPLFALVILYILLAK